MTNETIVCCKFCKVPLVWTFIYSDSEWYCVNCGNSTGMLDEGHIDLEKTEELSNLTRQINDDFKEATKNYLAGGCQIEGCPRCGDGTDTGKYHIWHVTDAELLLHQESLNLIEKLKDRYLGIGVKP